MTVASAKSLFRATKPKARIDLRQAEAFVDLPIQRAPEEGRDPLDYDPTPPDATAAFLAVEGARIRQLGGHIWEPAAGGGHMVREMRRWGFDVTASDLVGRGFPGVSLRSFYDFDMAPAPVIVTNPPYCEVNARDGGGRWLRHTMSLRPRYTAMLLNADWPAARINGMDALHEQFPMSRVYICCWKIDFRGGGSPPQRNIWAVWDADWQGETVYRRLFREGGEQQEALL
ncbi:hypothetical protein [Rhodovulum sulfidophilum]|uniref:hypothetical protein n=1 Tax=Rhodovulum sulfidophilum TaxID=35806 RepID=UPI000950ED86|nr:hypothetical protein [Rhodovulum sulfidophilum]OLS53767.1 hypothetical protein BV392_18455 [Rhodovulum sulfidophilum]